jgi:hypothetical protein
MNIHFFFKNPVWYCTDVIMNVVHNNATYRKTINLTFLASSIYFCLWMKCAHPAVCGRPKAFSQNQNAQSEWFDTSLARKHTFVVTATLIRWAGVSRFSPIDGSSRGKFLTANRNLLGRRGLFGVPPKLRHRKSAFGVQSVRNSSVWQADRTPPHRIGFTPQV